MKKLILGIFLVLLALLLYGIYIGNTYYMGHKTIVKPNGEYQLIWGAPYDVGSSGYAINDEIDSLKSVKWNNRIIVIEQNIEKENRWAIIKPKSDQDTLLNRMQDTLIRDLTKFQIDSIINYIKADSFIIEDLKPDIIKNCCN